MLASTMLLTGIEPWVEHRKQESTRRHIPDTLLLAGGMAAFGCILAMLEDGQGDSGSSGGSRPGGGIYIDQGTHPQTPAEGDSNARDSLEPGEAQDLIKGE